MRSLVKHRFTGLLISLFLMLFLYPYFEGYQTLREELLRSFFILVLFTAVYAMSDSRRHLVGALCLGIPVFVLNVVDFFFLEQDSDVILWRLIIFVAFNIYVIRTILAEVLRDQQITRETLSGAMSVYLLMGMTWGVGYYLLEYMVPGSFHSSMIHEMAFHANFVWTDFVYLSFVNLTTLGYGDIVPITSQARSLCIMEAVAGVLYTAVMISRLAAMYRRSGLSV